MRKKVYNTRRKKKDNTLKRRVISANVTERTAKA